MYYKDNHLMVLTEEQTPSDKIMWMYCLKPTKGYTRILLKEPFKTKLAYVFTTNKNVDYYRPDIELIGEHSYSSVPSDVVYYGHIFDSEKECFEAFEKHKQEVIANILETKAKYNKRFDDRLIQLGYINDDLTKKDVF